MKNQKRRKPGYPKRIIDAFRKFLSHRFNQGVTLISLIIILASFLPLFQNDLVFVLSVMGFVGEIIIGSIYFMWNIGSLTLLLILEPDIAEAEKIWVKWMIKRNLYVAAIWALITIGLMIIIPVFTLKGAFLFLFGAEIFILSYIRFFTTTEESPFLESTQAFEGRSPKLPGN
ncbi:MAG: hypothetical protein ACFFC7_15720 [Candidatus Hermodarchaeota archaeon]